jgi:hypothetical protein
MGMGGGVTLRARGLDGGRGGGSDRFDGGAGSEALPSSGAWLAWGVGGGEGRRSGPSVESIDGTCRPARAMTSPETLHALPCRPAAGW